MSPVLRWSLFLAVCATAAAAGWSGGRRAHASLQNLKGETRVTGTALLFQAGAAHDFAAAAAAWQNQAEGTLRVRAATGLAAGATAEDRAAVDALLSTLSPGIR